MKLADVSELIWRTVKKYLPDELAPNSNEEINFFSSREESGEKATSQFFSKTSYQSSTSIPPSSSNSSVGQRPAYREFGNFRSLGSCLKMSIIFISSSVWIFKRIFTSFVFGFGNMAFTTQAIFQYYP